MHLILSVFKKLYCEATGDPTSFSAKLGEYAVRPALLRVISHIRARDGTVSEDARNLIMDSVRFCDSGSSPHDDSPIVAALVRAVGEVLRVPQAQAGIADADEDAEVAQWLASVLDYDSVQCLSNAGRCSARHAVTVACISSEAAGGGGGGADNHIKYVEHAYWQHSGEVRLAAFRSLLVCIA